MTSHNVPFSYTAADVEVVSCLSFSLWEASFILLWEEVTQVDFKFRFPCDFHPQCTKAPPAPLSSIQPSILPRQRHFTLSAALRPQTKKFNCLIYEVIWSKRCSKTLHRWENAHKQSWLSELRKVKTLSYIHLHIWPLYLVWTCCSYGNSKVDDLMLQLYFSLCYELWQTF